MADEFDDIFGDITPTKSPTPKEGGSDNEDESDVKKGPSTSTEFDSMLMELDDAMQTTSTTSTTDDFSDIFGDLSPTRDDGKSKGSGKNKEFRSTYEKDDFMGWLKEGEEGTESLSPGSSGFKKRTESTMSDDFGDIFGETSSSSVDNGGVATLERANESEEEGTAGETDGKDDNDSTIKDESGVEEDKPTSPRIFSDDETNNSDSESSASESDDDLDFVIHSAPSVITNDNDPNRATSMTGSGAAPTNNGVDASEAPKFHEKKEDGTLEPTEVAAAPVQVKSSFLSSITSSNKQDKAPVSSTSSTTSTSSKFLSGFSSSISSAMASASKTTANNQAEKDVNTTTVTVISRVIPAEPEAEEVAALEAAFQQVELHRKVLAEEKQAAEDAGAIVGSRAGHVAALKFRLQTEVVNVARVRMVSAKMAHILPEDLRAKVWGHLLLGSDLWEDRSFDNWLEKEYDKENPSELMIQIKSACGALSSDSKVIEDMSALLGFYCHRRDAKEFAPTLVSCCYPLVSLELNKSVVSSCFYSFTSSLTPSLMLPLDTRMMLTQEHHHAFKLLLSYHDPLLAQHLERRVADWHLPHVDDTNRETSDEVSSSPPSGLLPSAALSGLFSAMLPLKYIYPLWDNLLGCGLGISTDADDGISSGEGRLLQPFLLLALLLREHSKLVLLDGDVLVQGLKGCLSLYPLTCSSPTTISDNADFLIDDDNSTLEKSEALIKSTQARVDELIKELESLSVSSPLNASLSKEDLEKKLEEMESEKKKAAKEKNFKLAGSIAKEIKSMKEKLAASGEANGTDDTNQDKETKISELNQSLVEARALAAKAQADHEALTNNKGSSTEASAPVIAACHAQRLKHFQSAQQWLVYGGLGVYLPGFAVKEIDTLEDLLDPKLCGDEDLVAAPIYMASADALHFRSLCNACMDRTLDENPYVIKDTDEKYLNYSAVGPTTSEFSHHDIVVMQWCLEAYELFRRTPTSFIVHALKDAESRHLAMIGGELDQSTLSSITQEANLERTSEGGEDVAPRASPSFTDTLNEENGGSCMGRFCIEVSVGEVVPQLCKASAHGSDSVSTSAARGRSASVLTSDSSSLMERALDMASLGVLTQNKCGTLQYLGRESSPLQKPRFLCLDCRPSSHVTRWGKFATTFTLDTPLDAISHDPDAMDRLFDMFAPMRGKAHIVLMGVGSGTHSAMDTSGGEEQCGLGAQDLVEERAHLAGLVLLFQKRNFPLVSVLEGGFSAARLFLSQVSKARQANKSASLPICGLGDLIEVGTPSKFKSSIFSTISTTNIKLPSYSMARSVSNPVTSGSSMPTSSTFSSLLSSSNKSYSGTPTTAAPTQAKSKYAFASFQPNKNDQEGSATQEGGESETMASPSISPSLSEEQEVTSPTGSDAMEKETSEASNLAVEALTMMQQASTDAPPSQSKPTSNSSTFNMTSFERMLFSSSKPSEATTTTKTTNKTTDGTSDVETVSEGEAPQVSATPVDEVEKPSPPAVGSSSSNSATTAAAAASSMYASMSSMRFSFASSRNTTSQPQETAQSSQPPGISAEELAALQTKELEHGFRMNSGSLEKGEVSIAHMKVAGMVKGTVVDITAETFPDACLFRCEKLKMKSEEFGKVKLCDVPRVARAMVVTKDRVLILNYSNEADNDEEKEEAVKDVEDDKKEAEEKGATQVETLEGTTAQASSGAQEDEEGDKVTSTTVESAQQLMGFKAVVKSNHHLTEIVKMTKLKKEPDILTLHYRDGAAFDTATLEGVRRRAYKMYGGKDEFIECLQVAMDRFA